MQKALNIYEVLNKPLIGDTLLVPHVLCEVKPSNGLSGLIPPDGVPAPVSLQIEEICVTAAGTSCPCAP